VVGRPPIRSVQEQEQRTSSTTYALSSIALLPSLFAGILIHAYWDETISLSPSYMRLVHRRV